MSQEISVFQFDQSHVRTIICDDEPWFVAKDVATALGYSDTNSAVSDHCKKAKSLKSLRVGNSPTPLNNVMDSQTRMIPESDVYRLVLKSKLPSAERFQDWLTEDVLPTIRKTGKYSMTAGEKHRLEVRERGKRARKDFTSILANHGVSGKGFAECTNEVYQSIFNAPAKMIKRAIANSTGETDEKKIDRISIRDNIDGDALAMILVTEKASGNRIERREAKGAKECRRTIQEVGCELNRLLEGK